MFRGTIHALVFVLWFVSIFGTMVTYVPQSRAQTLEELKQLATKHLASRASKWRCDAAAKFHCSTEGCRTVPPTVWINIDFSTLRYERCDSKGCNGYQMRHSPAGIYTVLSPITGAFLKVRNDGKDFLEVASLETTAFVAFGQCTPRS